MASNQQFVTSLLKQRAPATLRKALLPTQKALLSSKTRTEVNKTIKEDNLVSASKLSKENRRIIVDYMELTKFKLSLLNSVGSYTMFYFHAPLIGVGLANSALFLFAT